MTREIASIFNQFQHSTSMVSYKELNSGHINDTYLIETTEKPYFVLQRINHGVFKNVPELISNKVKVSAFILNKKEGLPQETVNRTVLRFVKTTKGATYFKGPEGNFWNLMYFIDDSVTHETVTDAEIAYEGGKLFGDFLLLTADYDASTLYEVIPKFHDMSFRFSQYEDALEVASAERLEQAADLLVKVASLKEEIHILQNLKEKGAIPLRVTHNDTKISNALFSKDKKGLCVIDTDTVMPGIVHYDFGDAIRTICNTAAEDEQDLNLVHFNTDYYKAYKKGFLEKMGDTLTPVELQYLPLAAKTMIFIMALRFLTDFLNGDTYYKTNYANHNIDRSRNQFKLIESLIAQESEL